MYDLIEGGWVAGHVVNDDLILLRRGVSDECQCPEREYVYKGIHCLTHLERDGSSDTFMDAGDWTDELNFSSVFVGSIKDARLNTMQHIDQLPEAA